MANTNAPFGARVLMGGAGSAPNFEQIPFTIDKDDSTAIYTGDFVKKLTTGYGAQWTAATAVSQLLGIFVGCEFLSTLTGKWERMPYWPGSGAAADVVGYVTPLVLAQPMRLILQTDATGVTFADIGANFDVAMGTGNTTTGRSGMYADVSTINTTATLPLRLEALYAGDPTVGGRQGVGDGTQSGAYNWGIFVANIHGTTGLTA